uniref:SAP domain-containing protein n=1 Tax=Knipowitschia caucasica TaxID=637954 RepID=A0AAV2JVV3_KNICA
MPCAPVLQFRLQQRRSREAQTEESMPLNHGKFPKQEDSYAFEEDSSSGSLSPEQQVSEPESHSSACTAEGGSHTSAITSPCQRGARDVPEQTPEDSSLTPLPVAAIVKSKSSDKNRHKKPKDVKPKMKKLKYHQYIPPDQKGAERSPPPMDQAYARLLQQQQLFLQLQILSQQKHANSPPSQHPPHPQHSQHSQHSQHPQHPHSTQGPARQPAFSYQPTTPTQAHKGSSEALSCSSSSANSTSSSPVKTAFLSQSSLSVRPGAMTGALPGPLPSNLDDLKVSELRQHLRVRGMPVSGTKTSLIERLRPLTEPCCGSSPPSEIATGTFPVTPSSSLTSSFYTYPGTSSGSPPLSPASSSELSLSGSLPDSFSDMPPCVSPLLGGPGLGDGEGEREKDKMLVEKQKVIDELTWKLHQEQRQVEELKMQLHKRKRCYGSTQDPGPGPAQHSPTVMGQHFMGVSIKQEPLSSSCPLSSQGPGGMQTQLMEGGAFLSPQASPKASPPPPRSPTAPYLLTPPLGRDECTQLQPPRMCPMQMQQKSGGQMGCYPPDHRLYPTDTMSHGGSVKSENMSKQLNRSQQMDELLDVLIENGGCPGLLVPRFHRHYDHAPPAPLPYDHPPNHAPDGSLESPLSAPIGRGSEGEGYGSHSLQGVAFSMAFSEGPWDGMEWLDLTPPTSANNAYSLAPPTSTHSVFTSEFLDMTDMSLGVAMDLPLEHW